MRMRNDTKNEAGPSLVCADVNRCTKDELEGH